MRMLQKKCNDISMPQQYKARDIKIDFIKGILIFLVVLGHSIQYGSGVTFFPGNVTLMIYYLKSFTLFICHVLEY